MNCIKKHSQIMAVLTVTLGAPVLVPGDAFAGLLEICQIKFLKALLHKNEINPNQAVYEFIAERNPKGLESYLMRLDRAGAASLDPNLLLTAASAHDMRAMELLLSKGLRPREFDEFNDLIGRVHPNQHAQLKQILRNHGLGAERVKPDVDQIFSLSNPNRRVLYLRSLFWDSVSAEDKKKLLSHAAATNDWYEIDAFAMIAMASDDAAWIPQLEKWLQSTNPRAKNLKPHVEMNVKRALNSLQVAEFKDASAPVALSKAGENLFSNGSYYDEFLKYAGQEGRLQNTGKGFIFRAFDGSRSYKLNEKEVSYLAQIEKTELSPGQVLESDVIARELSQGSEHSKKWLKDVHSRATSQGRIFESISDFKQYVLHEVPIQETELKSLPGTLIDLGSIADYRRIHQEYVAASGANAPSLISLKWRLSEERALAESGHVRSGATHKGRLKNRSSGAEFMSTYNRVTGGGIDHNIATAW